MLSIFYSLYLLFFGPVRFFCNDIQLVLGLHKVWSNVFSMALLKVPVVLENLLMTLNIMLNSVNPMGALLVRVVVFFNYLPVALD